MWAFDDIAGLVRGLPFHLTIFLGGQGICQAARPSSSGLTFLSAGTYNRLLGLVATH
jgi:hypothetical protein